LTDYAHFADEYRETIYEAGRFSALDVARYNRSLTSRLAVFLTGNSRASS